MRYKPQAQLSFSDQEVMNSLPKKKKRVEDVVLEVLDWKALGDILAKVYPKGKGERGRLAYSPVLLFKICLLQTWYNLSDERVEDQLHRDLVFQRFCGLSIGDDKPDHSVISRFRTILTDAGGYDRLFAEVNRQLRAQGYQSIQGGTLVDASLTPSAQGPKGKRRVELDESGHSSSPQPTKQGDPSGGWTYKAGKWTHGYKKHCATDVKGEQIVEVITTSAQVHDSQCFEALIDKVSPPAGSRVLADKGYTSAQHSAFLKSRGLVDGILKKGVRGRPLCESARARNRILSKVRSNVERVFGSIKRWFGSQRARYVGLSKVHSQHVLEALSYNLYRVWGVHRKLVVG